MAKETPWTEQKVMYKDGNVDVYRKFNWETWKRMTEDERAMWTEQNEATPAPISKEVIEFNQKISDKLDEVVITDSQRELDVLSDEEKEKLIIKGRLKELGIRYTHNSKLETLKKKLADADNSE